MPTRRDRDHRQKQGQDVDGGIGSRLGIGFSSKRKRSRDRSIELVTTSFNGTDSDDACLARRLERGRAGDFRAAPEWCDWYDPSSGSKSLSEGFQCRGVCTMLTGPVSRSWQRFRRISLRGLIILVLAIGAGLVHLKRLTKLSAQPASDSGYRSWTDPS